MRRAVLQPVEPPAATLPGAIGFCRGVAIPSVGGWAPLQVWLFHLWSTPTKAGRTDSHRRVVRYVPRLLYQEKDEAFHLGLWRSRSGAHGVTGWGGCLAAPTCGGHTAHLLLTQASPCCIPRTSDSIVYLRGSSDTTHYLYYMCCPLMWHLPRFVWLIRHALSRDPSLSFAFQSL